MATLNTDFYCYRMIWSFILQYSYVLNISVTQDIHFKKQFNAWYFFRVVYEELNVSTLFTRTPQNYSDQVVGCGFIDMSAMIKYHPFLSKVTIIARNRGTVVSTAPPLPSLKHFQKVLHSVLTYIIIVCNHMVNNLNPWHEIRGWFTTRPCCNALSQPTMCNFCFVINIH